jgi:hypothetical protein
MAGITPDISTSSFKPLSLDEIMMVPLAKQKQEDEAILALDELDAMQSNALGQDQDYVSGQIAAFRKESDDISTRILDHGVDRSLVNKVRGLRRRKNEEFSISGKTGQAAAAFNQYQANKDAILKRKDLTEEQKRLGVAKALEGYQGVENAGVYEDYIGASFIDVMKKGRSIAAAMKPEERAAALGIHYDPQTQTYRDGTKSYKKLTPNHIKQVVYGALQGDQSVQNYLKDIEGLGAGNAEEMMREAAISAGDVYQVSSIKDQTRVVANPNGADKVLEGDGALDLYSNWNSSLIQNVADAYNGTLGVTTEGLGKLQFKDGKLYIPEFVGPKSGRAYYSATGNIGKSQKKSKQLKDWEDKNELTTRMTEAIAQLRKDDPQGFMGKDDQYVLNSYVEGAKKAAASYATVVRPRNNENSFYEHYTDKILGTKGRVGDMTSGSRSLKLMGAAGLKTPTQVAEDLGFNNIKEFNLALTNGVNEQGKAVVEGMVNDPDIPMGIVVHMKDGEGISHRIVVSPEREVSDRLGQASTMMKNLAAGIGFQPKKTVGYNRTTKKSETHNEYYINKAQNIEGLNNSQGYVDYTPLIIRSRTDLTEDEARRVEWDSSTGRATLDGKYLPNTLVMTYDEQIDDSMNKIARKWATTKQGKNKE